MVRDQANARAIGLLLQLRAVEDEMHRAERDLVARIQRLLLDLLSVDEGPVVRTLVHDLEAGADGPDLGMHPRDRGMVEPDIVSGVAAERRHRLLQLEVA